MSIARKRYTPDEKKLIFKMAKEGHTYKAIAEKIRPGVSTAWRSIGDIIREERDRATLSPLDASVTPNTPRSLQSIIQPPTKSNVELPEELKESVTATQIIAMLDDEQRQIFVATYEDLRGQADDESVTSAENDMLMRAALSHTQYLRAAKMYGQCESFLMQDLNGEIIDPQDPRKRMAGRGDSYKKEMETKHKEYMDLISGLKLQRSQRLDKIKDTRNTLLDLQTELANKGRQDSIIEDIKRINNATIDEFKRMAAGQLGPDGFRHKWLIGAFDHLIKSKPSSKKD